jgi:hypothetical protein
VLEAAYLHAMGVKAGNCVVQWRKPGVIELVFSGHASSDVVVAGVADMRSLLAQAGHEPLAAALIDTSPLTGFDAAVNAPGRTLLSLLVDYKVSFIACVATSGPVRMVGSALSMTTGARVRFYATVAEADAAINDALAKLAAKSVLAAVTANVDGARRS